MRLLLDECVNAGVKQAFPGHLVRTVPEMGWSGTSNGKLLALVAGNFDVFVTIDQNIRHQQSLTGHPFAILLVSVPDNNIGTYRPFFEKMDSLVSTLRAGEVKIIP